MYIVGRLCELDRYYHASQGSTSLKCSILFWGLKLGYYFLSCKARSPRTAPYFYCSFSYFNSIFQALGQSYKETILQSEYSLLKQLLASQVRINLWSYIQLWAYGTFVFKKCQQKKRWWYVMELPICWVLLIKVICSKSWSDVPVYVLHKNMSFFHVSLVKVYFFAVLCSVYIILFILHWQVEDKFKLTLEYTNTCSLSDTDIGSFLASNITNTLRMIVGLDENETIGNVNEHSLFSNKKKFLFFFVIAVV